MEVQLKVNLAQVITEFRTLCLNDAERSIITAMIRSSQIEKEETLRKITSELDGVELLLQLEEFTLTPISLKIRLHKTNRDG